MARVLEPTAEHVEMAARVLREGGIVGMPTETVYGLAGNALNEHALASIFKAKDRPTFDPLIVHVNVQTLAGLAQLQLIELSSLGVDAQKIIEKLLQAFWPGPLTLVLPKSSHVPDLATSGLPTVALRMPRHPVARALIQAAGTPLAAPSANRFGRISPTSAQNVAEDLQDRIEVVLDGGACEVGVESTVISIAGSGKMTLLRPGGLPIDQIEQVAGTSVIRTQPTVAGGSSVLAPGMLESHYAPRKPFYLLPNIVQRFSSEDRDSLTRIADMPAVVGLLVMEGDGSVAARLFHELTGKRVIARSLSLTGSLEEAARNLFSEMRFLDASEALRIFSEPCLTQEGLGYAIGDRLKRASAKR